MLLPLACSMMQVYGVGAFPRRDQSGMLLLAAAAYPAAFPRADARLLDPEPRTCSGEDPVAFAGCLRYASGEGRFVRVELCGADQAGPTWTASQQRSNGRATGQPRPCAICELQPMSAISWSSAAGAWATSCRSLVSGKRWRAAIRPHSAAARALLSAERRLHVFAPRLICCG
jgi:hypothetical protein